jgi:hypothetical protein
MVCSNLQYRVSIDTIGAEPKACPSSERPNAGLSVKSIGAMVLKFSDLFEALVSSLVTSPYIGLKHFTSLCTY